MARRNDRVGQAFLSSLSMLLIVGLGGWILGLAAEDLEAAGLGWWGLLIGGFGLGLLAGLASKVYRYGSFFPLLTMLVLACAAGCVVLLHPRDKDLADGGWKSVGVSVLAFTGFLIAGPRLQLRRWIRRTTWHRERVRQKIRQRIAAGVHLVSDEPGSRCKFCPAQTPVEDYVSDIRANVDPWLRTFGDRLVRCPHNPKHVYHVIHFAENDWVCPLCSRPLFPDLADR